MTAHETVPATSPRQADDRYLAACSALLVALATDTLLEDAEADALCAAVDGLPSGVQTGIDLSAALRVGLASHGLVTAKHWGLGR